MAYNSDAITPGVGASIAVDRVAGADYQIIKPVYGGPGVTTEIAAATPLPMEPGLKLTEQCTRAVISFAASGDNALIAAVVAQYVRVYALMFTVDSPVSVKLGDTTVAYLTGAMKFGLGGGLILTQQGEPHFITALGKGFLINLSAAVQCSGVIWYTQAP
jgi:hypothetical protein